LENDEDSDGDSDRSGSGSQTSMSLPEEEERAPVDLSNYFTKEEITNLLTEQLTAGIDACKAGFSGDVEAIRADVRDNLQRLEEVANVARRVELQAQETDRSVAERQQALKDDLELILKRNQREKSDLQAANMKLVNRIDRAEKKLQDVLDSVQSICTITLCLVECACMQVRVEEQDDEDRNGIALLGRQAADGGGSYGATPGGGAAHQAGTKTARTFQTLGEDQVGSDAKTLP